MRQNAAAGTVFRQIHFAHRGTINATYAIEASQRTIQKRVIGGNDFHYIAVVSQNVREQHFRRASKRSIRPGRGGTDNKHDVLFYGQGGQCCGDIVGEPRAVVQYNIDESTRIGVDVSQ